MGVTPSGTSGGYIKDMKFTEDGMFAAVTDGDSAHYYCDAMWFNNSISAFALFGGASTDGAKVGAFFVYLNRAVSDASWYIGAAISCKPLA